jgi:formyl-CoA transferase
VRLSRTPAKKPTPSPVHGQHTREVLQEVLGMSAADIDRLEAAGVVKSGKA